MNNATGIGKLLMSALAILFTDLGDSIDLEDIKSWNDKNFIDAIINVLIEQNFDNHCPFKNYGCEEVCHREIGTHTCDPEIIIDCDLSPTEVWENWIKVNIR